MKIENKEFLARGHRAIVYIGKYKGKKVAIKVEREDSKAINRTQNEVKWLKILNKYKIGPKLISYDKNYFICEFVEGERIVNWLKKANKKEIKKVLKEILLRY